MTAPRATFRYGSRSFFWRLSRRLRMRMTWEYWRSVLATMLWAAPLTLLIWGVAEREQIEQGEVAVRLDPRSANTTLSVRVVGREHESIRLVFEGPRVGVTAVQDELQKSSLAGGLEFHLSEALPVGEVSTIDLQQALQNERMFTDNGISIISTRPATIEVFVDRIVSQTWPVTMAENEQSPGVIVTFAPTVAKVFGPARALSTSSQQLHVDLPDDVLADAGPEPRNIGDFPLVLPDDVSVPVTIDPQRVSVTLHRNVSAIERHVIRTMVIKVAQAAATEERQRIRVNPYVLNNVEVAGPPDVIARLQQGELQSYAVLDVPPGVQPGSQRGTLRIELPTGVRLIEDPPTVDYEVIPIEP